MRQASSSPDELLSQAFTARAGGEELPGTSVIGVHMHLCVGRECGGMNPGLSQGSLDRYYSQSPQDPPRGEFDLLLVR